MLFSKDNTRANNVYALVRGRLGREYAIGGLKWTGAHHFATGSDHKSPHNYPEWEDNEP